MKKTILISTLLLMSMFVYGCSSDASENTTESIDVTKTEEDTVETVIEGEAVGVQAIKNLGEDYLQGNNEGYYMFFSPETNGNGIMDSDGEVIIEPTYFYIEYTDGLFLATDAPATEWYFLNIDGTLAFNNVDGYKISNTAGFNDGLAIVTLMDSETQEFVKEAVIDKTGNILIQNDEVEGVYTKVDDTYVFSNTYTSVSLGNYDYITHVYSEDGTELNLADFENYDGDDIYEFEDIYFQQDPNTLNFAVYDIESEKNISDFDIVSGTYGSIGDTDKIGDNYVVTKFDGENFSRVLMDGEGNTVFDIEANYPTAGTYFECDDKLLINLEEGNASVVLDENGTLIKELPFICDFVEDYGTYYGDVGLGIINSDFEVVTVRYYNYIGKVVDGSCLVSADGILYKLTFYN